MTLGLLSLTAREIRTSSGALLAGSLPTNCTSLGFLPLTLMESRSRVRLPRFTHVDFRSTLTDPGMSGQQRQRFQLSGRRHYQMEAVPSSTTKCRGLWMPRSRLGKPSTHLRATQETTHTCMSLLARSSQLIVLACLSSSE